MATQIDFERYRIGKLITKKMTMKKTILSCLTFFFALNLVAQCYETLTFGAAHTIGKKSNGTIWGWGESSYGQLMTSNSVEPTPIQIGAATDWNSTSNGVSNTFAIKNNGTLGGVAVMSMGN